MKPMKKFLLLCLFGISFSCGKKDNIKSTKTKTMPSFPVILKTKGLEEYINRYCQKDEWNLPYISYRCFYVGPVRDSLPIVQVSWDSDLAPTNLEWSPIRRLVSNYHGPDLFRAEDFWTYLHLQDSPLCRMDIRFDTTQNFESCFPVMITNLEPDSVVVGYGDHPFLYLEAKDSLGNWKAIEFHRPIGCSTGMGFWALAPGHCIITLAPRYSGSYKTKFRFRIGKNMSKSFSGWMDYKQFSFFD